MVTITIIALIAVVAILGWRGVKIEQRRVAAKLKRDEAKVDKRAPLTLDKDPRTGVYRARKD